jgi:hypothetical protein
VELDSILGGLGFDVRDDGEMFGELFLERFYSVFF